MKRVIVFFIVGVVIFGACSAQNANAQSANIAQRIIGTWVDNSNGETWVFNANGNLTRASTECKFGVTDTQLAIIRSGSSSTYVYNVSISSDGKTLIILPVGGNNSDYSYWLTKR